MTKCFVLIDLKTGKLTHQDIGQMDSYICMFDALQKNEDDNPTLGIILCSKPNATIAKYSVLNDKNMTVMLSMTMGRPFSMRRRQAVSAENSIMHIWCRR